MCNVNTVWHYCGLEMEPTGEVEAREAKEQLMTVNGGGDERGQLQLTIKVRETFTRETEGWSDCLKDLCMTPPWGERV